MTKSANSSNFTVRKIDFQDTYDNFRLSIAGFYYMCVSTLDQQNATPLIEWNEMQSQFMSSANISWAPFDLHKNAHTLTVFGANERSPLPNNMESFLVRVENFFLMATTDA